MAINFQEGSGTNPKPASAPGSLYDPVHAPDAPNIIPEDPYGEKPEPDRVDVDTLIERPDLGEGATTFIAAGDPVPAALAHLPRRPRTTRGKGK